MVLERLVHIAELAWSETDVEHIARHAVRPEEVEEVIVNRPVWRRGRRHRKTARLSLYALGRTDAGRYLFVVLAPLGQGRARCLTAMEMDDKTRAYYQRQTKT